MEVDAVIWHWTPGGMRRGDRTYQGDYIEAAEVERLLEEAHARGVRQGQQQAEG